MIKFYSALLLMGSGFCLLASRFNGYFRSPGFAVQKEEFRTYLMVTASISEGKMRVLSFVLCRSELLCKPCNSCFNVLTTFESNLFHHSLIHKVFGTPITNVSVLSPIR
jgi:hypothetical protein